MAAHDTKCSVCRLCVDSSTLAARSQGYVVSPDGHRSCLRREYIDADVDPTNTLVCLVCSGYLIDPHQACPDHTVCGDCLSPDRARCPICAKPFASLRVEATIIEKQLTALKCHCPHKADGCGWTGTRSAMHQHHDECEFVLVHCCYRTEGCPVVLTRRDSETHQLTCPMCFLVPFVRWVNGLSIYEYESGHYAARCYHGRTPHHFNLDQAVGDRETTIAVLFRNAHTTPPEKVSISTTMLDIPVDNTIRWAVRAENVTATGFDIVARTWLASRILAFEVEWEARWKIEKRFEAPLQLVRCQHCKTDSQYNK